MTRLLLASLFLFAAPTPMHAQAVEYVPVSKTPELGHAPGMRVQRLTKEGDGTAQYAVIFSKGDEVASGLLEFAQRYKIGSAHFTGIGALSDLRVGWFDRSRKMYRAIPVHEQVEVLSLIGDIAEYKGGPAVHTHLVIGTSDGSAKGGHLLEAHVFPTLEVMVTVDPVAMHKTQDPETDLGLIDPGKATGKIH